MPYREKRLREAMAKKKKRYVNSNQDKERNLQYFEGKFTASEKDK